MMSLHSMLRLPAGLLTPTAATPAPAHDERARFIGAQHARYAAQPDARGLDWNWSAFVFGGCWLAYRKMYAASASFLLLLAFDAACENMLAAPAWVSWLLSLSSAVVFGLCGNRLYRWHVTTKIREIHEDGGNDAHVRTELERRGGTCALSALAYVGLLIAGLTALAVLLGSPAAA